MTAFRRHDVVVVAVVVVVVFIVSVVVIFIVFKLRIREWRFEIVLTN